MAILMRVRGWAAVAVVMSATGCELVREPTVVEPLERPATVHAILRAGDDTVRVLISRARVLGPRVDIVPVTGAEVWIHGPSGRVALRETGPEMAPCMALPPTPPVGSPEDDEGEGCYIGVLPAPVQPGERYGLSITLPSGDLVVGETNVPMPPTVSLKSSSRLVLRTTRDGTAAPASVGLVWSRGPDAVALQFGVGPGVAYVGDEVVPGASCWVYSPPFFAPWTRRPAGEMELQVFDAGCDMVPSPPETGPVEPVPWDSISFAVYVAAADTAYGYYYEHHLGNDVLPWPRAAAGLEGAVGVFGAVAVTKVPLMIVRENP
jgi:hypothetical protein